MKQRLLYLFFRMWLIAMVSAGIGSSVQVLAQPTPHILKSLEPTQTIQQLQIVRDPSRSLTIDEVAQRYRVAPPSDASTLNLGFTSDAVWIIFQVKREDESSPHRWWLELEQPLLMDVKLFEPTEDGRLIQQSRHVNNTVRQHAFDYRVPVFELTLDDLNSKTYFIRVVTQSSMSASMVISQPDAFVKHHANSRFIWGCIYGAFLMIVLFSGVWWISSRERIHLIYTLYVTVNLLASFFSGGWPRQFLPPMTDATYLACLGFWISLAVPMATLLTFEILQFKTGAMQWIPRWFNSLSAAVFLISLVLIGMGRYETAMPIVQFYILNFMLFSVGLASWRATKGDRSAQFFLMAFSFFYVGIAWRFLKNIGWLEPNFWSNNAYQIGAFGHMLIMSLSVFSNYTQLRREKEQVEFRLQAERQLREEQASFLGMVSHEFRTPLSIISSSSENLLAEKALSDPSRARVEKIIRANKRLSNLIEEYLSYERLGADSRESEYGAVDLVQVARRVANESSDAEGPSIQLRVDHPVMVMGDAELLRVVLHNLVNNARRHSPPQGVVVVQVGRHGNEAEVIVEDQGAGIADHERDRIFDKFFRGQNAIAKPGAGMGLYLAKSIMEKHGGVVDQRNLFPAGCQFVIKLPTC